MSDRDSIMREVYSEVQRKIHFEMDTGPALENSNVTGFCE